MPVFNAAHLQVVEHSAAQIQSDHACVMYDFTLTSTPKRVNSKLPKPSTRCGRWRVSTAKLEAAWPDCATFRTMTSEGQWELLCNLAEQCSFRAPSRRYRDSEALKTLCMHRRLCRDPTERTALTRMILSLRQFEHDVWYKDLLTRAENKDHEATKFLRRGENHGGTYRFDDAFQQFSGKEGFAEEVQAYFTHRFNARRFIGSCTRSVLIAYF